MKTNAVRLLDTLGIRYELREYEVDPAALDAETVARKIGLPAESVFKTLVARGDRNGVCMAVVPANMELDEKALARLTGDRKTELTPLREVQPLNRICPGWGHRTGVQAEISGVRGRHGGIVRCDFRVGGRSGDADPAAAYGLPRGRRGRRGRYQPAETVKRI